MKIDPSLQVHLLGLLQHEYSELCPAWEQLYSSKLSIDHSAIDKLRVLEPWPAWVADNPEHNVQSVRSYSMGSYYLVGYWDEHQGYPASVDR